MPASITSCSFSLLPPTAQIKCLLASLMCLSTCCCLPIGASQHALAEDTSPDVTQKLFQLNTLAPINLTQALLPHILNSKPPSQSAGHAPSQSQGDRTGPRSLPLPASQSQGDPADPQAALPASGPARQCHIVVVGSMAGKVPSPGQSVYSGCKTALMGYFASLQTELSTR